MSVLTEGQKPVEIYKDASGSHPLFDYVMSESKNIFQNSDGLMLANVDHGSYDNTSITGCIKITLPQSWTNTMMRFEVDIFDYSAYGLRTIGVGGYNYSASPGWFSTSATQITGASNNMRVRFGHDGTKCAIYIGETSTAWNYPKIRIRNFMAGHAVCQKSDWATGWTISIVGSVGTITSDITTRTQATYV